MSFFHQRKSFIITPSNLTIISQLPEVIQNRQGMRSIQVIFGPATTAGSLTISFTLDNVFSASSGWVVNGSALTANAIVDVSGIRTGIKLVGASVVDYIRVDVLTD